MRNKFFIRSSADRLNAVSRALSAAFVLAVASQTAQAAPITFGFTGALETYTVLTTGTYNLTAFGAQGGASGSNFAGGKGAQVTGGFSLTAGDQLQIVVGGQGTQGSPAFGGYAGGGGGGSFIYHLTNATLLMAAGGGGGGYTGNLGGNGLGSFGGPGVGGNGNGQELGGGGGGFNTNGSGGVQGGRAFPVSTGGQKGYIGSGIGGFGGGGGGGGYGAGGGGGFNGGNAGNPSTGGTSFCSGLSCLGVSGFQTGNGEVLLELVSVPNPPGTVPEPGAWALVGVGLLATLMTRRRPLKPAPLVTDDERVASSARPEAAPDGAPKRPG